jgi:HemY protein
MIRTVLAILLIALLVAIAVFLGEQPGSVTIEWQGREIYTDVGVLAGAVIVAALVAALLIRLALALIRGPSAFLRARRERRRREGYRALTQGMVAVAAGDPGEAARQARKADVLLAEPPLTLLLSAQAAQLNGDEQAAKRYFSAMLDRPETEFLGLRGLIMQALRGGDEPTALQLATRAKELRPRTPWVMSSLFELQARAGQWAAADATLAEAVKRTVLTQAASRHHRAVLNHTRSVEAERKGLPKDALRLAAQAYALDPGFAPAAVRYAGLLRGGGKDRHARKVIEGAWRAAPHPALAQAYEAIDPQEPALDKVKEMERLVALQPEHIESRLAAAGAALKAKLWGEARRHLLAAGAEGEGATPAPRLCRMMAELEMAEHGDLAAARGWLARAATTTAADPTWVCRDCGSECEDWAPLCPACRSFDSLAWRTPGGTLPARLPAAAAGALAPPLPVPSPWPAGT